MKFFLFFALVIAGTATAAADELRPAYLQLQQSDSEHYSVLWKVPGRGDAERLALRVELPEACQRISPSRTSMVNYAIIERWNIQCTDGLTGKQIHIDGLSATSTDVLVRIQSLDSTSQVARLSAHSPSFVILKSPGMWDVANTYLVLGIEHILSGFDHLLFVLALLLIVGQRWLLLIKTITAFTIAHSITLTLATLGFVQVSQTPVEAVIALSIMFVASEILHIRQGRPGLAARKPWVVAFCFGLLHGFGFASALNAIGLPENSVPLALLLFNVGVEIGQLLFIAMVMLIISVCRNRIRWPGWTENIPPYVIGSYAAFWAIQRILAF